MEFVIFTRLGQGNLRETSWVRMARKASWKKWDWNQAIKKDTGKEQHEQKQRSNEYGKLQYLIGRQESQLEENGKLSWIGRMET